MCEAVHVHVTLVQMLCYNQIVEIYSLIKNVIFTSDLLTLKFIVIILIIVHLSIAYVPIYLPLKQIGIFYL